MGNGQECGRKKGKKEALPKLDGRAINLINIPNRTYRQFFFCEHSNLFMIKFCTH